MESFMGERKRKKKNVRGKKEKKKKFVRLQPPRLELSPSRFPSMVAEK